MIANISDHKYTSFLPIDKALYNMSNEARFHLSQPFLLDNSFFKYLQNGICHKAHNQSGEDVPPIKRLG